MGYYYYDEQRKKDFLQKFNKLPDERRKELEKLYQRQVIAQELDVSYPGKLVDLMEQAKEFAKEWGVKLEDVEIRHDSYEDYGSTYSRLKLEVKGLETDFQYYARLGELDEHIKYREDYERKEFERLSAKFSKK